MSFLREPLNPISAIREEDRFYIMDLSTLFFTSAEYILLRYATLLIKEINGSNFQYGFAAQYTLKGHVIKGKGCELDT